MVEPSCGMISENFFSSFFLAHCFRFSLWFRRYTICKHICDTSLQFISLISAVISVLLTCTHHLSLYSVRIVFPYLQVTDTDPRSRRYETAISALKELISNLQVLYKTHAPMHLACEDARQLVRLRLRKDVESWIAIEVSLSSCVSVYSTRLWAVGLPVWSISLCCI